jgi:hypothetical protein
METGLFDALADRIVLQQNCTMRPTASRAEITYESQERVMSNSRQRGADSQQRRQLRSALGRRDAVRIGVAGIVVAALAVTVLFAVVSASSPQADRTRGPRVTTGSEHQPAPIVFEGHGRIRTTPFLLAGGLTAFTGAHQGGGSFSAEIFNQRGEPQHLLFLANGPYRGSVGLGLTGGIYRLTVAASTPWSVTITQPRPRNIVGAALPQRYQGRTDMLVGPFHAGGSVVVEIRSSGSSDISVELVSADGSSLYWLVDESGGFHGSRTAADLQDGDYYLNVDATGPWTVSLRSA